MSGGHDTHKETTASKWIVPAICGVGLAVAIVIATSGDGGNERRVSDAPAGSGSAGPAAASAPVGFCVGVPNQQVTAPVTGWSDPILVPSGCTIYRDASSIRTQCRNNGEREWRDAEPSGACTGDMERHQSKVGEPVTQTVYFRQN